MMNHRILAALLALPLALIATTLQAAHLRLTVEAEEEVYRFEPADNGAGPFWCFGSTCIARLGDDVFVSGLETIPNAKPLNNTRWMLFRRHNRQWALCQKDPHGRTREPCPIGVFAPTDILLSVNPTLTPPDQYAGPAQPQILRFNARSPSAPPETILPAWNGMPPFTEHSYRSFALDGPAREMILFQNIGYTHAEWAFRNKDGKWTAGGRLPWPHGADYAKPQPIRVCYPSVQLKNGGVYFCGVSDITEPNPAWRDYKRKLTGREWDYDFRRLFFTWAPDISTAQFKPWIEIASREKTAGHIFPCDLLVADDDTVHLLWYERALDPRLRNDFFPNEKQSEALNWAVVRDGKVVHRQPILLSEEGKPGPVPGRGRFHLLPDGRLLVLYYLQGNDLAGKPLRQNRLVELRPDRTLGPATPIPLKLPMDSFFTASIRAGNAPTRHLDLLGQVGTTVRYACIRIE